METHHFRRVHPEGLKTCVRPPVGAGFWTFEHLTNVPMCCREAGLHYLLSNHYLRLTRELDTCRFISLSIYRYICMPFMRFCGCATSGFIPHQSFGVDLLGRHAIFQAAQLDMLTPSMQSGDGSRKLFGCGFCGSSPVEY